jgi:hypothetical protein
MITAKGWPAAIKERVFATVFGQVRFGMSGWRSVTKVSLNKIGADVRRDAQEPEPKKVDFLPCKFQKCELLEECK